MAPPYAASCLCGGITYTVTAEPHSVFACFCQHCSKGAGSTHQIVAKCALETIDIASGKDLVSIYSLEDTVSGFPKQKAFCKACGCTLWTIPVSVKGTHLMMRASLLTGGLGLKPTAEIFTKNRPAWIAPLEGAAQHTEAMQH